MNGRDCKNAYGRGRGQDKNILHRMTESLGDAVLGLAYDSAHTVNTAIRAAGGIVPRGGYKTPMGQAVGMYVVPALPVILAGTFLVGAVSQWQVGVQVRQMGLAQSVVSAHVIRILFHALVPVFTAFFAVTAIGAGAAARLFVLHERRVPEAFTLGNIDPVHSLVSPLLVAVMVTMPLVMALAEMSAVAGAAFSAWWFGSDPRLFVDFSALRWEDGVIVLAKAAAFGFMVPVTAGARGLPRVSEPWHTPGRAASMSVLDGLMMCGGADLFLGYIHKLWVS